MIKALLIGCGNIGAGYDLNDDAKVWSHAKAYSLNESISLSVYDADPEQVKMVSEKYNAVALYGLEDEQLKQYHIVSIATSTKSHFFFLEKLLKLQLPVIICEKPVVDKVEHAEQAQQLYNFGSTRILVNYIRRFQPSFKIAKEKLLQLYEEQGLRGVIIKYKRGFLNNASHAIDLLEFFFETHFHFDNFQCSCKEFDSFEFDPTLTGSCCYLGAPVTFTGVSEISYSLFDIELFFGSSKVGIYQAGDEIRYYQLKGSQLQENFAQRQLSILSRYMIPVVEEAIGLLYDTRRKDNFTSALNLNKKMLQIIASLKSDSYGKISD